MPVFGECVTPSAHIPDWPGSDWTLLPPVKNEELRPKDRAAFPHTTPLGWTNEGRADQNLAAGTLQAHSLLLFLSLPHSMAKESEKGQTTLSVWIPDLFLGGRFQASLKEIKKIKTLKLSLFSI